MHGLMRACTCGHTCAHTRTHTHVHNTHGISTGIILSEISKSTPNKPYYVIDLYRTNYNSPISHNYAYVAFTSLWERSNMITSYQPTLYYKPFLLYHRH